MNAVRSRSVVALILALLIVAGLQCMALAVQPVNDHGAAIQTSTQGNVIAQPLAASDTVYVTRTGTKYHRDGCRYLRKSKISMKRNAAVKAGYTACSVCKP